MVVFPTGGFLLTHASSPPPPPLHIIIYKPGILPIPTIFMDPIYLSRNGFQLFAATHIKSVNDGCEEKLLSNL